MPPLSCFPFAQAAADLELPLKDALASGADPVAVLDSFVAPPCAKPLAFVSAFRAFAVFMESDAEELVRTACRGRV